MKTKEDFEALVLILIGVVVLYLAVAIPAWLVSELCNMIFM